MTLIPLSNGTQTVRPTRGAARWREKILPPSRIESQCWEGRQGSRELQVNGDGGNTDDDDDDDDDNDEKKSNSKRQKRKEISPLKPVKIEDEGMGISI